MLEYTMTPLPVVLQNPHWLSISGLQHGFSTRMGGVSQGAYASLNVKFPTGADSESAEAVRENRRRLGQVLGMNMQNLVACRQCHGSTIYVVQRKDAGAGALSQESAIPDTDGLITAETGIPLFIQVADCLPVLLLDPGKRIIGAVHAGWRGTAARILEKAIQRMHTAFGCQPEHIQISIGPGIGFEHFEVGAEVAEVFRAQVDLQDPRVARTKGSRFWLNLAEINRRQAMAAGVPAEAIFNLQRCTFSEPDYFFSFRRDRGQTGRLAGVIGWLE